MRAPTPFPASVPGARAALRRIIATVALATVVVGAGGCELFEVKVPVVDILAGFTTADATWFAEEETLFVFYRVEAEQGIGPDSRIELAWQTDDEIRPMTPVDDLEPVHVHVPVSCGPRTVCGSMSVHVPLPPRNVELQLRYHKDGEATLAAPLQFSGVGSGPPHVSRSLLVYGVFDEDNAHVQWRARHQFPRIRNEEAQAFGLRRRFEIQDAAWGDVDRAPLADNVYGYGLTAACPPGLTPTARPALETTDRAIFEPEALPLDASTTSTVCARATVDDATGSFTTTAHAWKNPETAPPIPSLRSPIEENTRIGFLLQICDRVISESHLAMQIQRLELEDAPAICIDDFAAPDFAQRLAARFAETIDVTRTDGADMILLLALHHDDTSGELAAAVEDALARVIAEEAGKSSPRMSGAFVLDSVARDLSRPELGRFVLWCPSPLVPNDLDELTNSVAIQCALQPGLELPLGPVRLTTSLPVFPSRIQYERFVEKYSVEQAGRVLDLSFRAPRRTPLSTDVPVGELGVATFFNNEVLTAVPTDVFSFCPTVEALPPAVFRFAPTDEVMPIAALPEVHRTAPQPAYPLGLLWDFPYLLRVNYEAVLAGAVTAFSVSVPFGKAFPGDQFFGAPLWDTGVFPLDEVLLRCTRFCGHPTFDSAGVYNVRQLFDPTFLNECYRPKLPRLGDGGFPLDP